MELTLDERQAKSLLKEIFIELLQEKRELLMEIILEAIEEIGLANAIREGRKNQLVSEESILAIIEEQVWSFLLRPHYDYSMSWIFFEELPIPEPYVNLGVGSGSDAARKFGNRKVDSLGKVHAQVRCSRFSV